MTGKEILEEEFEKAGMRGGYKSEQVDEFLQAVAKHVDEINDKNSDLTYKIQILADKIEEYKKDEESIRDALLGAQKLGTSILNEAKSKAETLTRDAKNTADDLLAQAKNKVEFLTKDSLQKANVEINAAKKECEREQKKLDSMKQEVSNFRSSILKQYKSHLDLLSNLPSVEPQESVGKGETKTAQIAVKEEPPKPVREEVAEQVTDKTPVSNEPAEQPPTTPEFVISQNKTIKSDIVVTDDDIEQEVKQQTKEFGKGSRKPNISAREINDRGSVSPAVPFNPPQQKTNFAEKYGELDFGKYKDK